MKELKPFTQMGPTHLIPADSTAPAGVLVEKYDRFGAREPTSFRIFNSGSVIVHIGWGATAAKATANAVAATAGTPKDSIVLAPGAVEVLGFSSPSYFSGLSASAVSVYISCGEGV